MKVLWLSNRLFESSPERQSGTWLKSLALLLASDPEFQMGNISSGNVRSVTRCDLGNIMQWSVPTVPLRKSGLPAPAIVNSIQKAVEEFGPDIIQVWGTEGYWGLLTGRGLLHAKHILNIQGVLSGIEPVYYGGLTTLELLSTIGLREIVNPSSALIFARNKFFRRTRFENEIIASHRYIVTQSSWSRSHVHAIKSDVDNFKTERTLRDEFVTASPWSFDEERKPILFTSCAGRPYKGIHVLIRSLAILKRTFPSITLKISGAHIPSKIRMSGYDKWLRALVRKLNLDNNVEWLGSLTATQIVDSLQCCSVFINPSFVESYSLSLSEALYLGVPSVAAYAGAMPEIAKDSESALFFTPGDHFMCASKIFEILRDPCLAKSLGQQARKAAIIRNDAKAIAENQKNIYRKVYASTAL